MSPPHLFSSMQHMVMAQCVSFRMQTRYVLYVSLVITYVISHPHLFSFMQHMVMMQCVSFISRQDMCSKSAW